MYDHKKTQLFKIRDDIQVAILGSEEIEDLPFAKKAILKIGGGCANTIGGKFLAETLEHFPGRVLVNEVTKNLEPTNIILLEGNVMQFLTPDEIGCLLEHEKAHITNGDVLLDPKDPSISFLERLQMEVNADAAAAKIYGKEKMRSLILKVMAIHKNLRDTGELFYTSGHRFQPSSHFMFRLAQLS